MDDSKEQRAENGEFNGKIAETAGERERERGRHAFASTLCSRSLAQVLVELSAMDRPERILTPGEF